MKKKGGRTTETSDLQVAIEENDPKNRKLSDE